MTPSYTINVSLATDDGGWVGVCVTAVHIYCVCDIFTHYFPLLLSELEPHAHPVTWMLRPVFEHI